MSEDNELAEEQTRLTRLWGLDGPARSWLDLPTGAVLGWGPVGKTGFHMRRHQSPEGPQPG